jgi:glutathione S-transferase
MNIYTMPFERRVLSVFTDFEAMLAVNPLGKVPVLQLEDGELLYDSRAILDYLVGLVPVEKRLVPAGEPHRRRILRIEAVALGLAEKLTNAASNLPAAIRPSGIPRWSRVPRRRSRRHCRGSTRCGRRPGSMGTGSAGPM